LEFIISDQLWRREIVWKTKTPPPGCGDGVSELKRFASTPDRRPAQQQQRVQQSNERD
jgi:hypothetical protein